MRPVAQGYTAYSGTGAPARLSDPRSTHGALRPGPAPTLPFPAVRGPWAPEGRVGPPRPMAGRGPGLRGGRG